MFAFAVFPELWGTTFGISEMGRLDRDSVLYCIPNT